MADPFMGTVMPVAFQFAPTDWQTCQGQSLQVSQYSALYSLLGTVFGGNGSTSFNLPDLQGRTIVGQGMLNLNGGLTSYIPGAKGGASAVTLTSAQVPLAAHTHTATAVAVPGAGYTAPSLKVAASGAVAGTPSSSINVLANAVDSGGDGVSIYAPAGTAATIPLGGFSAGTPAAAPTVAVNVGANTATPGATVNILNPYLSMFYLIAINGIYPSRP